MAIFLMIVGLIIIFSGLWGDITSGALNATFETLLPTIIGRLSSGYFTSGLSLFGIGLALVTIAFSDIE
ncbi:MAG: hypothetical protein WC586_04060 [Methanoregula sp.]